MNAPIHGYVHNMPCKRVCNCCWCVDSIMLYCPLWDHYVLNVLNALHKCYLMWLIQHIDVVNLDVDYYWCFPINCETTVAFLMENWSTCPSMDFSVTFFFLNRGTYFYLWEKKDTLRLVSLTGDSVSHCSPCPWQVAQCRL